MHQNTLYTLTILFVILAYSAAEVLRCLNGEEIYVDAAVGSSRTVDVLVHNLSPATATVVLSISGDGFSLVSASSAEIPARATATVQVKFTPTSAGIVNGQLSASGSWGGALAVQLRGLGRAGDGGDKEPSLQRILNALHIGVNVGDDDESTALIHSNAAQWWVPTLGDEVPNAQLWEQADASLGVSVDVLAVFGPVRDSDALVASVGFYPNGASTSAQSLLSVDKSYSQRLQPPANGTSVFQPMDTVFGIYVRWPYFDNRLIYSEDALNTWDAGHHHVRAFPLRTADGTAVADAFVLCFEEYTDVADFNDLVLVLRNVRPAFGIKVQWLGAQTEYPGTPFPGYSNNIVIFSRINNNASDPYGGVWMDNDAPLRTRDTNTVYIRNRHASASLQVHSLTIENLPGSDTYGELFRITTAFPAGGVTVAPLQTYQVVIKFVAAGGDKGLRSAKLTVASSDPAQPSILVYLEGLYMAAPEGAKEISLVDILDAHHWPVYLAETTDADLYRPHLSEKPTTPLQGEEIRSKYFVVADPSQPVTARVVASYRSCCNEQESLKLRSASNIYFAISENPIWGQSVLPAPPAPLSEALFNDLTANVPPSQPFYLEVGSIYNTTFETYRGIITYPLRGPDGQRVPHTYLVLHDYVMPYYFGCTNQALGYANCDFNDNVFLVQNIMPYDSPNPERLLASQLVLSWNAAYENTLLDGQQRTTGFTSVQQNSLDLWSSSNSYQPQLISVGDGSLTLKSAANSFIKNTNGTQSELVNGLQLDFDGTVPFVVEALVTDFGASLSTGTAAVGIFVGPDRFFNVRLVASKNAAQYVVSNSYGGAEGTPVTASGFSVGGATKLAFRVEGNPGTRTLRMLVSADGGAWVEVGSLAVPAGDTANRLFARVNRAGVIVASEGASEASATFVAFAVLPGCSDPEASQPIISGSAAPPIGTILPTSNQTATNSSTATTTPSSTTESPKPSITAPGSTTTPPSSSQTSDPSLTLPGSSAASQLFASTPLLCFFVIVLAILAVLKL